MLPARLATADRLAMLVSIGICRDSRRIPALL
jgi:hypothetical protein